MNSEDWNQETECADCGATISPMTDRAFGFDDDTYLCFACATERGGVYDDRDEVWTVFPDVTGELAARARA
jgi:hypothetical protein